MAGFLGGLTNLGNVANTNAMQGYMNVLKGTMGDLNTQNNLAVPQINDILKGNVTKTEFLNDQELINDLNILTRNNPNNDGMELDSDLSADKTVKTFSKLTEDYMNGVNTKQKDAESAVETFASGGKIDLHTVMIAMEKSNLSMQLTMQMRNKILQAYQEISRMNI